MDILRLRTATAADHEAVEGSLPLMGETLDRAAYTEILSRIYPFVAAWEEFAEAMSPEWLAGAVERRSRRSLLAGDLAFFGVTPSPAPGAPCLPAIEGSTGLLGAMYVTEGSRLGGQLIARHVQQVLHLPEGQGTSYFQGSGAQTGLMWREFVAILESRIPECEADAAILSAKQMFACFGRWMQGAPSGIGPMEVSAT